VDGRDSFIKTKAGTIFKYSNKFGKEIKLLDLMCFRNYSNIEVDLIRLSFYFTNFKNTITPNEDLLDEEGWFFFHPDYNKKIKNYLYYANMRFCTIDLPAYKDDVENYYISSVNIKNNKNKTTYMYNIEDMQLAVMLAYYKVGAVADLFGIKIILIKTPAALLNPNEVSYLELFEHLMYANILSFEVYFEELKDADENEAHYFIVSYPIFNDNDTLTIIRKHK
jgi:hypothetical protein